MGLLWAARRRRKLAEPDAAETSPIVASPETLARRLEMRMEAIEGIESALSVRLEALGSDDSAERRLQAMAKQILGLVRDKNASLDTALAGLDQLRARLRMLEQIGDPAEARGLLERLNVRIDGMEVAQSGVAAAVETRLGALESAVTPYAEISDQLTRLYAQKDATVETVFARLAPLEAKLGALEATLAARDPGAALERFADRLEAARAAQEAAQPRSTRAWTRCRAASTRAWRSSRARRTPTRRSRTS